MQKVKFLLVAIVMVILTAACGNESKPSTTDVENSKPVVMDSRVVQTSFGKIICRNLDSVTAGSIGLSVGPDVLEAKVIYYITNENKMVYRLKTEQVSSDGQIGVHWDIEVPLDSPRLQNYVVAGGMPGVSKHMVFVGENMVMRLDNTVFLIFPSAQEENRKNMADSIQAWQKMIAEAK